MTGPNTSEVDLGDMSRPQKSHSELTSWQKTIRKWLMVGLPLGLAGAAYVTTQQEKAYDDGRQDGYKEGLADAKFEESVTEEAEGRAHREFDRFLSSLTLRDLVVCSVSGASLEDNGNMRIKLSLRPGVISDDPLFSHGGTSVGDYTARILLDPLRFYRQFEVTYGGPTRSVSFPISVDQPEKVQMDQIPTTVTLTLPKDEENTGRTTIYPKFRVVGEEYTALGIDQTAQYLSTAEPCGTLEVDGKKVRVTHPHSN